MDSFSASKQSCILEPLVRKIPKVVQPYHLFGMRVRDLTLSFRSDIPSSLMAQKHVCHNWVSCKPRLGTWKRLWLYSSSPAMGQPWLAQHQTHLCIWEMGCYYPILFYFLPCHPWRILKCKFIIIKHNIFIKQACLFFFFPLKCTALLHPSLFLFASYIL